MQFDISDLFKLEGDEISTNGFFICLVYLLLVPTLWEEAVVLGHYKYTLFKFCLGELSSGMIEFSMLVVVQLMVVDSSSAPSSEPFTCFSLDIM